MVRRVDGPDLVCGIGVNVDNPLGLPVQYAYPGCSAHVTPSPSLTFASLQGRTAPRCLPIPSRDTLLVSLETSSAVFAEGMILRSRVGFRYLRPQVDTAAKRSHHRVAYMYDFACFGLMMKLVSKSVYYDDSRGRSDTTTYDDPIFEAVSAFTIRH